MNQVTCYLWQCLRERVYCAEAKRCEHVLLHERGWSALSWHQPQTSEPCLDSQANAWSFNLEADMQLQDKSQILGQIWPSQNLWPKGNTQHQSNHKLSYDSRWHWPCQNYLWHQSSYPKSQNNLPISWVIHIRLCCCPTQDPPSQQEFHPVWRHFLHEPSSVFRNGLWIPQIFHDWENPHLTNVKNKHCYTARQINLLCPWFQHHHNSYGRWSPPP